MILAVNGVSATTGGGVTYLKALLRAITTDHDNPVDRIYVFVPEQFDTRGCTSECIQFVTVRYTSTLARLLWEQFSLPRRLQALGVSILYSPANIGCLFYGGKQILTIQNLLPFDSSIRTTYGRSSKLKLLVQRWLSLLSAKKADVVTFTSQFSYDAVTRWISVPAVKTVIIRHGVEFPPQAARGRDASRVPTILCVSDLYRHKNVLGLLRAYAILHVTRGFPHHLELVGRPIDQGYFGEINRLIESLGLSQVVSLRGHVPHHELSDYYCRADVLVYPSLCEVFGLPILEAMSFGVPVCASNISGIPEACSGAAFLFDPRDPSDIADKLSTAICNADVRRTKIQQGYAVASSHSWEAVGHKFIELCIRLTTG